MQHIHVFVGTHEEVEAATKAAIGTGFKTQTPAINASYPELTHVVLAVTVPDGGDRWAYCFEYADSCVQTDMAMSAISMKSVFEQLVQLLAKE